MPRDGAGVYTRPTGIDAVTDATIQSSKYNLNVQDVETDLNTPRPVVAGGTGSSTAAGALANVGAAAAKQTVTNYDTFTFLSGFFWSDVGATTAPAAGQKFYGEAIVSGDATGVYVRLTAYSETDGKAYSRVKTNGVWAAWTAGGVPAGSIDNTQLATMAALTVKGNKTGSAASPTDVALGQGLVMDATSLRTLQQMSITTDGSGLKLANDNAAPGNNQVYGTTSGGVKGWKPDPAGGLALSGGTLTGALQITANPSTAGYLLNLNGTADGVSSLFNGLTKGIKFSTATTGTAIDGTNQTGSTAQQLTIGANPLVLNGNTSSARALALQAVGTDWITFDNVTPLLNLLKNVLVTGTLQSTKAALETVVTLTDGASVALDASLGNLFALTAAGSRTISAPTNAVAGQKIVIMHRASGAAQTLTLTTGSAGAFRFGSDITALTQTVSAKVDYIGAIYNATDSRWDVVSYVKGF